MILGSVRKVPQGIEEIRPELTDSENETLKKQGQDTTRLHLVVDMNRLGAKIFNVKMEYTYFAPRSGKNYLFEMVLMSWPGGPMPFMWAICSFPIEYRPQAEELAKECGLRIADGIPTIFTGNGAQRFPLDGPTVFTLENITGHQAYANDPAMLEKLRNQEHDACDVITEGDCNKLKQEMRDSGYLDVQIERILAHWENGNESYDEAPALARDGQHRHKKPL